MRACIKPSVQNAITTLECMISEAKIQAKILKELEVMGGWWFKVLSSNRSGVPDIIGCYRGRLIGLEVKAENGRASALQEHHIKMINKAGGVAGIVRSVAEVKALLGEDASEVLRR
jgi:Holliday junction resolvase